MDRLESSNSIYVETEQGNHSPNTPIPYRILVVEDEENISIMLKEFLGRLPNCEVTVALDGWHALQLFEPHIFDLLLTDYNMPGMDGITLANYVKSLSPQTPIILLTGYANSVLYQRAAEVPIQHVLDKPIKLKEIRRTVLETLMIPDNGQHSHRSPDEFGV